MVSKEANFIMVYGICRAHSGYIPLKSLSSILISSWYQGQTAHAHPAVPSLAVIVEIPLNVPEAKGGMVVCIRTFTASNGQSAISARNSADALAVRYKEVLYL